MAGNYIALDEPDSVVLSIDDVIFARALEDNERRGMKENFRTFIQFRSGRVHYLYMEFPEFLRHFNDAVLLSQGVSRHD
jgi:hypothetical protein